MNTQSVTLEGAKLKEVFNQNDTSKILGKELANRSRFRTHTDISHLKNILIRNGEKIILEDYMSAWKHLQQLGVGSIIIGRNGRPTRFKWNYSLKKVGEAGVTGDDVDAVPLTPTKPQLKQELPKKKRRRKRKVRVIETQVKEKVTNSFNNILYIPLRKNVSVSIKIPSDLTDNELDTICEAIRKIG